MKIEAIDRIRATDDDGRDLHMEAGDVRTVGPNFGKLACSMGWAKDVDGNVPTGEKTNRPVTVSPTNLVVKSRIKGA
jgi:hypothetical protein